MNFRLAFASLVAAGSCTAAAAFTPKAFVAPSKRVVAVPDSEQLWRPSSATNMVAGGAERGMQDEYYDGEFKKLENSWMACAPFEQWSVT